MDALCCCSNEAKALREASGRELRIEGRVPDLKDLDNMTRELTRMEAGSEIISI